MTDHSSQPPAGIVVAMDGTSGSGKSSTSREVATRLGLRYLDTGAMYRAVAWWVLQQGIDPADAVTVAGRAREPRVASGTDPRQPTIAVDDRDVSVEIRSAEVNGAVSPVAAVPAVRSRMLSVQRATIAEALAEGDGIVVEGRDIGSVVAPQADVKVYLTADPSARATRRAAEEGGSDVSRTTESLLARDRIDSSRSVSPLVQADGAVPIDTTELTLHEVVDRVVELALASRSKARG